MSFQPSLTSLVTILLSQVQLFNFMMTIFEIAPSLHGPGFIAEGCDHLTGNVYSGGALGGSYEMGLVLSYPIH